MTEYELTTDEQGVRDLRQLRAGLGRRAGVALGAGAAGNGHGRIVVELLNDLPEGDYAQHKARQVRLVAGEWQFVKQVDIRKISHDLIPASNADGPTRLFAVSVSNLGLCVTDNGASSTGTSSTTGTTCCGCIDPDQHQTYDWGDGEQPVTLEPTGHSFGCCDLGAVRLRREVPDGTAWESTGIECVDHPDSATVDWSLGTDGVLTITHSIEGLVGRYVRNQYDTDLMCAQRFALDEATTPLNDSDCPKCAESICLKPVNGFQETECFNNTGGTVVSQHDGQLPEQWLLTVEAAGDPSGTGEDVLTWRRRAEQDCSWGVVSCDVGLLAFVYSLKVNNEWELYAVGNDGIGCVFGYPAAIVPGQTPLVSWTDDDFNPLGSNVATRDVSGVIWTYTLEPL